LDNNLGYLLGVYSIIWIVLFVYVLFLLNGQRKLRKEIAALKETLEQKGRERKS
jgi:CcmD family protein